MELLTVLSRLTNLPEQHLTPILELFGSVEVPAKKLLLTPGEICSQVWLVGSGSLRSYYFLEERKRIKRDGVNEETVNREVTNWIIPQGGLYTDMPSFSPGTPSSCYVETLQTSQLFTLSRQNYDTLLEVRSKIAFKIFEQVVIGAEMRIKMGNLRHPEDRMRVFELTHPGFMNHVPVNIQASYLSIDPNTLSRLRAKQL